MKLLSSRPSLAAVFFVIGLMLVTAFNTNRASLLARPQRAADLASVVIDMERQHAELTTRLGDLRARMTSLEKRAASDAGLRETFSRRLEEARWSAGMARASGPGMEVSLADAPAVPAGVDPNVCVIHDYDVAAVVNALSCGGATAVSINGQRVVATTSIRCAGSTILINGTRVVSPYTVDALGDPAALGKALQADSVAGPLLANAADRYGLRVSDSVRDVSIAAYGGSMRIDFGKTRPAAAGEKR